MTLLMLTLENRNITGEIINIGSGRPTTIQELAETMLSLAGVYLQIIKIDTRSGDIKQSYSDISKANKLLGYKPEYLLTAGLSALLRENKILNA